MCQNRKKQICKIGTKFGKIRRIRRNKMIQAKVKINEPEVVWDLNISEDGKTYQRNFMVIFPRYSSAIDDE